MKVVWATARPTATSGQQAELYASTGARTVANGKAANIYTDSPYTVGAARNFGVICEQRGFLTSEDLQLRLDSLLIND